MSSARLALLAVAAMVALFPPAAAAGSVRDAALGVYVHGMTQEIADAEVGREGVPELLCLLEDPAFPRRDNVVAFLAYLGGPEATPGLLRLVEHPPAATVTPEEDRALLLVPEALARIGSRGDEAALALLRAWAEETGVPADLARMARRALLLPGGPRVLAAASGAGNASPESLDGSPDVDETRLDYANHASLTGDFAMTDERLDDILGQADLIAGRADYPADVACCSTFTRFGAGTTFGSPGDGHDVIDSVAEEGVVIGDPSARVKIVRLIQSCGGPGTNIVGCSFLSGKGMAMIRLSSLTVESVLWLHEYGHNVGLGHAAGDTRLVMSPGITSTSNGLRSVDCAAYHTPPAGAQAEIQSVGPCTDDDGDEVQDAADNCTLLPNNDQSDGDGDGIGDVCEACVDPGAPDIDGDGNPDPCEVGAVLADADLSGRVDGFDLARMARAFGALTPADPRYDAAVDLDRDGAVDGDDLASLVPFFGQAA